MSCRNAGSYLWETVAILLLVAGAVIQVCGQERAAFGVARASAPPKIDGILDDEAWQQAP